MNNYRLSTNKNTSENTVDRLCLQEKINKLLSKPSNFEIKEDGKIIIKSLNRYYYNNTKPVGVELQNENGLVVKTWNSITECAKNLNMSKADYKKD